MKFLNLVRVFIKIFISRYFVFPSFCKECGINVCDFIVEDKVWLKVQPTIKYGYVLCYNCFCKKGRELNLPSIWKLTEILE